VRRWRPIGGIVTDTEIQEVSRKGTTLPTQQLILDAGGATLSELYEWLHRNMAVIEANQILEVVSHRSRSPVDISAWCLLAGHEFLSWEQRLEDTLVWIKKCAPGR
jgi:TusA-related sulfurtransferase